MRKLLNCDLQLTNMRIHRASALVHMSRDAPDEASVVRFKGFSVQLCMDACMQDAVMEKMQAGEGRHVEHTAEGNDASQVRIGLTGLKCGIRPWVITHHIWALIQLILFIRGIGQT